MGQRVQQKPASHAWVGIEQVEEARLHCYIDNEKAVQLRLMSISNPVVSVMCVCVCKDIIMKSISHIFFFNSNMHHALKTLNNLRYLYDLMWVSQGDWLKQNINVHNIHLSIASSMIYDCWLHVVVGARPGSYLTRGG